MISQTKERQIKKKCISIQPRGLAYWERLAEILNRESVVAQASDGAIYFTETGFKMFSVLRAQQ